MGTLKTVDTILDMCANLRDIPKSEDINVSLTIDSQLEDPLTGE